MQNKDRFKFRAWDKKYKEMECFELSDIYWRGENTGEYDFPNDNNLIIMQCTGFKDKKGTLIYENDILQINNCNNYIVCFREETCSYYLKATDRTFKHTKEYNLFNINKTDAKCFEVVGNIYENEDLLTEKKINYEK